MFTSASQIPPSDRRRLVDEIVSRFSEHGFIGDARAEEELLIEHADLLPELKDELNMARAIHSMALAASRYKRPNNSNESITSEELEAPISHDSDIDENDNFSRLEIVGYKLRGEISRGGQATVYEAIQETTGRRVAIKVLPGGPLTNSATRLRFDREAHVLATLDHPNVVKILDRGRTAHGAFFLVMEYIDGAPLDKFMMDYNGPNLIYRTVDLFVTIAKAVNEAHAQGVVHRDLKPSNVRLDRHGNPHVLDFGLAHVLRNGRISIQHSVTEAGQLVGSIPWASPEQVSGLSLVDCRTDVYSLALMLYRCLTGRFPYRVHGTIPQVLKSIGTSKPARMRYARDGSRIPVVLEAIVQKALTKQPSNRYGTAGEFADDLARYLVRRPTAALPRARRPAKLVLLSVILAGAMGVAVFYHWKPPAAPLIKLPETTNSLGMILVEIPSGSFTMGSSRSESVRKSNEDQRNVNLTKSFWISRTEVTRRQYYALISPTTIVSNGDLPIVGISWEDAAEFCRRLSLSEGRQYRLPTEAEWEYTCRAGTTGRFGGDGNFQEIGWFEENSDNSLHPVGRKQPNHWGIYDMHGNAGEWCQDGYVESLSTETVLDPISSADGQRVIRGGDYQRPHYDCRSASRSSWIQDVPHFYAGFRIVAFE